MRLIDADKLDTTTITTDDIKQAQTIDAIPIPKGSTNRDILKILFPNEDRLFYLFLDTDWYQCRNWLDAPFEKESSAKGADNSDDERANERELNKKGKSKHYDKEMER